MSIAASNSCFFLGLAGEHRLPPVAAGFCGAVGRSSRSPFPPPGLHDGPARHTGKVYVTTESGSWARAEKRSTSTIFVGVGSALQLVYCFPSGPLSQGGSRFLILSDLAHQL